MQSPPVSQEESRVIRPLSETTGIIPAQVAPGGNEEGNTNGENNGEPGNEQQGSGIFFNMANSVLRRRNDEDDEEMNLD